MPPPPLKHWPHFEIGRVSMTNADSTELDEANIKSLLLLNRHVHHDWDDLALCDKVQNDVAVLMGQRLLSTYSLATGKTIWVLTEADRNQN
jgi:hypothetical protein